ncbi:hypothetical protein NIIDNTM18_20010 [Mycolicibacterium litorale]|uniref:Uncharacterized protein n=1 Tax=Mycolicibacterium litorale TaxID=758802 RepID=A0A6S6NZ47_9MYCO|nr:hypothetical protein [Mycolicibacterium litorale]BCI52723.1 hypothetical protein NIIDNTM18_20010 [Mycolicibacterium litorale]
MNILYTQALPLTPTSKTPRKVIVTEREVMLASTMALLAPPRDTRRRRFAVAGWFAALRREPRRHVVSRYDFTEHSRMAREMNRL